MWFLKWIAIAISIFVGIHDLAMADALDSWSTWSAAQPYTSKQVPPGVLVMRGEGTDAYYVVEVDPVTGAIPVDATVVIPPGTDIDVTNFPATVDVNYGTPTASTIRNAAMLGVGSTAVSNSNPVPISDAGGVITVDGTVAATQSGTWNITNISGTVSLPTDAATETTLAAINTKTPALGQAVMASSVPVVIASNQTAIPVTNSNLPATADTNVGAAGASTLRVTEGSRSYADSARYNYAGGTVTTADWTEVDSSTAAAFNYVCITDQSGQVMELGTGTAASETRVFLIARGFSGCIPLRIAASTRIAIKAVSANATTGDLVISGMQ